MSDVTKPPRVVPPPVRYPPLDEIEQGELYVGLPSGWILLRDADTVEIPEDTEDGAFLLMNGKDLIEAIEFAKAMSPDEP